MSWGHLRQTYCQHSFHRQTLLLVGSHAASPPFGTVFPHLYALLTVSLVLGLSSDLHVRKTFVAGPLSTPLMPLPGLMHAINSLLTCPVVLYGCCRRSWRRCRRWSCSTVISHSRKDIVTRSLSCSSPFFTLMVLTERASPLRMTMTLTNTTVRVQVLRYCTVLSIHEYLCCWSHARQTRCKLYFVNCIVTTSQYVAVVFTFKNTVQFPSLYFAEKPSFVIGFGFEQQCESSGVWKFLWKMLQSSWQEAKLSLG